MNLTRADLAANISTFNLALLGVLANLHGNVAPEYRPFVDVLMQAISRQVFVRAGQLFLPVCMVDGQTLNLFNLNLRYVEVSVA